MELSNISAETDLLKENQGENQEDCENKKHEVKDVPFTQIFRYSSRSDRVLMFISLLCTIGTGVCHPLSMLVFGKLTQDIITYALNLKEQEEEFMDSITKFVIYNCTIGVAMLLLTYISTYVFNYTCIRQIFKIRKLYFERTLDQDIAWYDVNQTGDYASRMSEDIIKLQDGMGDKVALFLHSVFSFLASLGMALVMGWKLALVCLSSLPACLIMMGVLAYITGKISREEMEAYGEAGGIANEVFGTIKTVVAFGGQDKEIARYRSKLLYARDNNIKRSFMNGIGYGLMGFFMYGSYALALWYGVKLVLAEREIENPHDVTYDAGTVIIIFFSVMEGCAVIGYSSTYVEVFAIAKGAAAKIFSVIDSLPVINASKGKGKKLPKLHGNLVFKDVHFDYPSRPDVKVLQGLDLTIKAGETVALVGTSGCGKSTIIQLLQRFYDPISGEIYLDDEKFDGLDLTWMRSKFGVVGQEPVLFATTIGENIRYGNLTASRKEIERAAERANAHAFISSLPKGYDTLVGERGAQLSGGQKQRIAIARALVREPSILLLDEATSSLDTNSEAKVQAAIDHASKDCTTIIVAHRLSTIRNADKIVVLSEGKVVEEGTHKLLMSKQGAYFNLVKTQASGDSLADFGDQDRQEDTTKMIENRRMSFVEEEEIEDPTETSSTSLWAIMKMNSPEWLSIVIGCLASLVTGATMPAFAIFFGEIIGIFGSQEPEEEILSKTNFLASMFALAGFITGFATFLEMFMFGIAGEKLTMRLRHLMFASVLKQEIGWFDRKENAVGSLCAKLSTEAASVQGATGQRIGTILQALSTLIIAISISMYYEWKLALVALVYTPFIFAAIFFEYRIMYVENDDQQTAVEKSTTIAVEAVSNIRTVASLGCERNFYRLYVDELFPIYRVSKRNAHARSFVVGIARSIFFFAFANCMYYGGVLIKTEGIGYDKVQKVSQALIMGAESIGSVLAFSPNLRKGLNAASNIFKILKRTPLIIDQSNSNTTDWFKSNISYGDVSFSYPTRFTVPVLKELNLSVFEGQTVALVGSSGCGKSTVLQLLERYYDPQEGEISVEKTDIKRMTLSTLRSQIGVVSQEPNLFDKTILENIAYGQNDRKVAESEIIEAAKMANIHTFISSLPLGYNTSLGEHGTQLSGGQKQRIAIARALVRNPKVLMLDEATSALDSESEKVVQEALNVAKKGRTCITIAHRLSTIQDADVICVMNQGQVAEMGTHSELIQLKGIYHKLHSQSIF